MQEHSVSQHPQMGYNVLFSRGPYSALSVPRIPASKKLPLRVVRPRRVLADEIRMFRVPLWDAS